MSIKALILAGAVVVFAGQQVFSATDHAEATFQKVSLSCQGYAEKGYGDLMGCPKK